VAGGDDLMVAIDGGQFRGPARSKDFQEWHVQVVPKTTDDFRVREILADNGEPPIAFCASATKTFTADSSRHRVVWQGNSSDKDVDVRFSAK
jgi:hypothetical protein